MLLRALVTFLEKKDFYNYLRETAKTKLLRQLGYVSNRLQWALLSLPQLLDRPPGPCGKIL